MSLGWDSGPTDLGREGHHGEIHGTRAGAVRRLGCHKVGRRGGWHCKQLRWSRLHLRWRGKVKRKQGSGVKWFGCRMRACEKESERLGERVPFPSGALERAGASRRACSALMAPALSTRRSPAGARPTRHRAASWQNSCVRASTIATNKSDHKLIVFELK